MCSSDLWYTPSHVIHGMGLYALLWLAARRRPASVRFLGAVLLESAWEVLENTPMVISHYRAATISLDYYGDSVVNSVMDIVSMIVGFVVAARIPVWATILAAVAIEASLAYWIRDNLALNILMLIYPLEAVRRWQAGSSPP